MSLKFVAPSVKNGKFVTQLDRNEVVKLTDIWENSIVMYFLRFKIVAPFAFSYLPKRFFEP